MEILSIQVGLPRSLERPDATDPMGKEWTTGFFKEPVAGPVWLGRINLAGDGQADLQNHGGLEKAVNVYPSERCSYWDTELDVASERLVLVDRLHPEWTVAAANEVMHHQKTDMDAPRVLGSCPALSTHWRETLARRVDGASIV